MSEVRLEGGLLRLLPAAELPAIFKPEVSDAVLVSIAQALAAHAAPADEAAWAVPWLEALTKVGRFDMTVMMLDRKAQQALAARATTHVGRAREVGVPYSPGGIAGR